MSQHLVSTQELRTAIRLLERTYVGVGDQDDLFATLQAMRTSLSTPLNSDRQPTVLVSRQRVSP